jgi:hypothetical protein
MARAFLRDDLLSAVGGEPDDAAASVGAPQCAVPFRKNAFRALQVVADVSDRCLIDAEVLDRIWLQKCTDYRSPATGF